PSSRGIANRRNPSPKGRNPSPNRRPPSPNTDGISPYSPEVTTKKVNVLKARLYLLQQNGPNSFRIGGDSPEHKYLVIIGPQSCNCGRGIFCIHVLFVMLRVFQLEPTSTLLWRKTLKNYEVESLFKSYHERCNSRISPKKKSRVQRLVSHLASGADKHADTSSNSDDQCSSKGEEENCPICLLQMVDGESVTVCEVGCRNKLHTHCVNIWAEECRRNGGPLKCPLCRVVWKPADTSHVAGMGPLMVDIPHEYTELADTWTQAFGWEMVSCLFSSHPNVRENALRRLSHDITGALLTNIQLTDPNDDHTSDDSDRSGRQLHSMRGATGGGSSSLSSNAYLASCCAILAMVCGDPEYRVYITALRTLRAMMAYTQCRNSEDVQAFQRLLAPVIETILFKCADSNRRNVQLSVSTVMELCRGQSGELAVGKEMVSGESLGIGNVVYLLSFLDFGGSPDTSSWQWMLGRLNALGELFREFKSELSIRFVKMRMDSSEAQSLLCVARFSVSCMNTTSQPRVCKMARRVFLQVCPFLYIFYRSSSRDSSTSSTSCCEDFRRASERRLSVRELADNINRKNNRLAVTNQSKKSDTSPGFKKQALEKSPSAPTTKEDGLKSAPNKMQTTDATLSHTRPLALKAAIERRGTVERYRESLRYGANSASAFAKKSTLLSKTLDEDVSDVSQLSPFVGANQFASSRIPTRGILKNSSIPLVPTPPSRILSTGSALSDGVGSTTDSGVGTDSSFKGGSRKIHTSKSTSAIQHLTSPESESTPEESVLFIKASQRRDHDPVSGEDSSGPSLPARPTRLQPRKNHNKIKVNIKHSRTQLSSSVEDLLAESDHSQAEKTPVTFKSEIGDVPLEHGNESYEADLAMQCSCRMKIEEEEDKLFAHTLAVSYIQDALPTVPHLSFTEDDVDIVRVQDETTDIQKEYKENKQWCKGAQIGLGAFSACYQARDMFTGTLMAVKQVNHVRCSAVEERQVLAVITEEISLMRRLSHPNIVRLHGITKEGPLYNIFIEWCAGGSVSTLLSHYGAFNEGVIMNYTLQLLRGLSYIHEQYLIHRDIKGANLLIDSTGQRLRISDFGAAARLASKGTGAGEFQGQLLGTIAFMAPEVLRGEQYGRSCDVWGCGCVITEMASGKPPWEADMHSNHLALIFKIASSPTVPPIPDHLSPAMKDLCRRCLQANPRDRPTAQQLLKHPVFIRW
uniref:Mitogen-activated protein kinase kinase kinase 1 n=1 Tax=Ciona savignyi TaxID=51511 RepID=H2YSR2_CIOSA